MNNDEIKALIEQSFASAMAKVINTNKDNEQNNVVKNPSLDNSQDDVFLDKQKFKEDLQEKINIAATKMRFIDNIHDNSKTDLYELDKDTLKDLKVEYKDNHDKQIAYLKVLILNDLAKRNKDYILSTDKLDEYLLLSEKEKLANPDKYWGLVDEAKAYKSKQDRIHESNFLSGKREVVLPPSEAFYKNHRDNFNNTKV